MGATTWSSTCSGGTSSSAVRYVSNITDVDDNIIKRAGEQGRTEPEVAAEFEARWWEAMDGLGVRRPDDAPHATAYIDQMVALVADLLRRGVAYETSDGVYLSVDQVDGYGLLARQSLDSLRAGARVEENDEKRSPLDCVVMSLDLLGDGFDLHGGGQDLAFPHHENERAQAVVEGRPFARHWVHNGWVEVEGTKMSKSLGNFTSLTDLLARHDGRAYRLLVLRAHYRSPIEVTGDTIADAEKALERLDTMARRFAIGDLLAESGRGYVVEDRDGADTDPDARSVFHARMDDDMDTPGALAGIFDLVTTAHSKADAGDERGGAAAARTAALLAAALGLPLRAAVAEVDEAAARLVAQRDEARRSKDFARADALRDELVALGWTVEDTPSGTAVRR
jgi:cysteinyl-tRNA synthetase